jgi:hypothetical protein
MVKFVTITTIVINEKVRCSPEKYFPGGELNFLLQSLV